MFTISAVARFVPPAMLAAFASGVVHSVGQSGK